jgi:hypothetical protein
MRKEEIASATRHFVALRCRQRAKGGVVPRYVIRVPAGLWETEREIVESLERQGIRVNRDWGAAPLADGTSVLVRGEVHSRDIARLGQRLGLEFLPDIGIVPL